MRDFEEREGSKDPCRSYCDRPLQDGKLLTKLLRLPSDLRLFTFPGTIDVAYTAEQSRKACEDLRGRLRKNGTTVVGYDRENVA
jgi:hypothetical protein